MFPGIQFLDGGSEKIAQPAKCMGVKRYTHGSDGHMNGPAVARDHLPKVFVDHQQLGTCTHRCLLRSDEKKWQKANPTGEFMLQAICNYIGDSKTRLVLQQAGFVERRFPRVGMRLSDLRGGRADNRVAADQHRPCFRSAFPLHWFRTTSFRFPFAWKK